MTLDLRDIALLSKEPEAPPADPRDGNLHLFDSTIKIWEENVEEDFKEKVFDPLIRFLRSEGWRVGQDPQILSHHKCLAPSHRMCRFGELEANLRMCGRTVEFTMFQNVENVSNRHGGQYDFNKFDRMPYTMRLRCLATARKLIQFLRDRHGYRLDTPKLESSQMRRGGPTALDVLAERYAACCHTVKHLGRPHWHQDYNRKAGDGSLLEHGQVVWIQTTSGRWLRGTAFYNLNSMWWVVTGPYSLTNRSCGELFTSPPQDLRDKSNERIRRKRLEKELAAATSSMNFERAVVLRNLLFGPEPMYRIWSDKRDAWYAPLSQGYASDETHAGLFERKEAERLTAGASYLRMIPVKRAVNASVGRGAAEVPVAA